MKTAPKTKAQFKKFIATATSAQLHKVGFTPWDEKRTLWLIPKNMYKIIPNGTQLIDIFGKPEKFKNGESDNDARYGCLPYGIIPKDKLPKKSKK